MTASLLACHVTDCNTPINLTLITHCFNLLSVNYRHRITWFKYFTWFCTGLLLGDRPVTQKSSIKHSSHKYKTKHFNNSKSELSLFYDTYWTTACLQKHHKLQLEICISQSCPQRYPITVQAHFSTQRMKASSHFVVKL